MIGLDEIIRNALLEDIHTGDITTQAVVPEDRKIGARLVAKEPMILCGVGIAERVFHILDHAVDFKSDLKDGSVLETGNIIAEISGAASSLLQGERVALNLLQRM